MTDPTDSDPHGQPPKSRQRLTVLFSDLSESTTLAGRMEAELTAALMHDLRKAFTEAVQAHGGTVNQFQGDALQAVFGFPFATEHDGRLAVEAALDVHHQVRTLRERYALHGADRLAVHSGVHSGLVLVQPGVESGSRLELSGSAPGVAKHLSDLAADDELLVSVDALGPTSHLFDTAERPPVLVKGRTVPLAVFAVLGTTALRTRFQAHVRRGLLPFIGREPELERLYRALRSAQAGACQFVMLRGAPGLGKTRLAEEFLRRAEVMGFGIARGDCDGGLRGEPLQPFVQILRARLGVAPQLPRDAVIQLVRHGLNAIDPSLNDRTQDLMWALSMGSPNGNGGGNGGGEPARAIEGLRDLIVSLARARPQVLFIDDWQWSDDATRRVVHALCSCKDLPLLVLAAWRPSDRAELTLTHAEAIDLGPLNEDEAARSIAGLLPAADPFLVDEIGRLSGGNPLFVEELCHFAARGNSPSLGAFQVGPTWLETLIESRVAGLPQPQLALLSAAAVIGMTVPGTLLEKLTGYALTDPLVQDLALKDLLVPSEVAGGLKFKHGITRDVVYAAVGLQLRRDLHQRVAELLRADGSTSEAACEALAYHSAGSGNVDDAAHFSEIAGDKAMRASSLDRAKSHYRAALDMLDRMPRSDAQYNSWRSLIRRLGLACVYDPARAEIPLFERAVDEARARGDQAGRAYAEYWLAYLHYSLGNPNPALAHGQQALDLGLAIGDPLLILQARIVLGQALAASGKYADALGLLARPELPATGPKAGRKNTPPAFAYALAVKGSVLGDLGRFAEAELCFEAAIAELPQRTHEVEGSILCLRACVAHWQGRFDEARRHALGAKRVAEQVRSLYLYAMALGLGGYADWKLEPGLGALRHLTDSTAWLEQRGKHLFISLNFGWLAESLAASGRATEARAFAAKALHRARHDDWLGAAMAMRALARAAAQDGAFQQAGVHLSRADAAAHRRRSPHEAASNRLCRAQVDAMAGRRAAARDGLEQAQQEFMLLAMDWHQVQAGRLLETL